MKRVAVSRHAVASRGETRCQFSVGGRRRCSRRQAIAARPARGDSVVRTGGAATPPRVPALGSRPRHRRAAPDAAGDARSRSGYRGGGDHGRVQRRGQRDVRCRCRPTGRGCRGMQRVPVGSLPGVGPGAAWAGCWGCSGVLLGCGEPGDTGCGCNGVLLGSAAAPRWVRPSHRAMTAARAPAAAQCRARGGIRGGRDVGVDRRATRMYRTPGIVVT